MPYDHTPPSIAVPQTFFSHEVRQIKSMAEEGSSATTCAHDIHLIELYEVDWVYCGKLRNHVVKEGDASSLLVTSSSNVTVASDYGISQEDPMHCANASCNAWQFAADECTWELSQQEYEQLRETRWLRNRLMSEDKAWSVRDEKALVVQEEKTSAVGRIGEGMGRQRTNGAHLSCSAKELFQSCKQYSHVVDTFIPTKRSKNGRRFGFVRFINVFNDRELVIKPMKEVSNEGFVDIKIQYMGELWVLLEFGSEDSMKLFCRIKIGVFSTVTDFLRSPNLLESSESSLSRYVCNPFLCHLFSSLSRLLWLLSSFASSLLQSFDVFGSGAYSLISFQTSLVASKFIGAVDSILFHQLIQIPL
ncbi:nucleotide-binding alpha-beta plait domain-containing protein [Tanacetum coccineum]